MSDIDPTGIAIKFDPTIQRMSGVARHGNTPFDVPFVSKLADNLWQGGVESGLGLPHFVNHVVSLYPWGRYKVHHQLDSFMEIRMLDSEDQGFDQVEAIARWINKCRKTGVVLVHCQAGLNRSSLVAARALMLDGMTADEAINLIRGKRSPACLCNPAFEAYLRSL